MEDELKLYVCETQVAEYRECRQIANYPGPPYFVAEKSEDEARTRFQKIVDKESHLDSSGFNGKKIDIRSVSQVSIPGFRIKLSSLEQDDRYL